MISVKVKVKVELKVKVVECTGSAQWQSAVVECSSIGTVITSRG